VSSKKESAFINDLNAVLVRSCYNFGSKVLNINPVIFSSAQVPLLAQKTVFKLAGTPLDPKSILGKVAAWQPRARRMESFGIRSGSSKEKGLGDRTARAVLAWKQIT